MRTSPAAPATEQIEDVYVVPPGNTQFLLPNAYEELYPDRIVIAISFRDAAGQRWIRDFDGILRPVAGRSW